MKSYDHVLGAFICSFNITRILYNGQCSIRTGKANKTDKTKKKQIPTKGTPKKRATTTTWRTPEVRNNCSGWEGSEITLESKPLEAKKIGGDQRCYDDGIQAKVHVECVQEVNQIALQANQEQLKSNKQ